MIFVVDAQAAGQMLRVGRLACPHCGQRLRVWTPARTRYVVAPGGARVAFTPDRGRCTGCATTHVVLPGWYVPRRAYTIEVIGHVLLAGAKNTSARAVAERLAVPVTTVSTWLRQARQAAGSLLSHAIGLAGHAVGDGHSPAPWLGTALAVALDALGEVARVISAGAVSAQQVVAGPGRSGIDYLGLLADRHYDHMLRQLHVVDPTGTLANAPAWYAVNLITARRGLLASSPG